MLPRTHATVTPRPVTPSVLRMWCASGGMLDSSLAMRCASAVASCSESWTDIGLARLPLPRMTMLTMCFMFL